MYQKYTMQTLLDDFDIIKLYQQSGKAHHFSKMTKKQVALYEAIRVQIPTYIYLRDFRIQASLMARSSLSKNKALFILIRRINEHVKRPLVGEAFLRVSRK